MALYALTIFLGALLLFQVQPLIGKFVLPWFGGGPAVWTTCVLFFQLLLLAGYAYAHVLRAWLPQRKQVVIHIALLAAALATLPIIPSARWKPVGGADPTWGILVLLAATVGLTYLMLSPTSPLLQAWFSLSHPGRSPYRLYALSNAGSLLALVSYPFLVEPAFTLRTQALLWSVGFALFTLLCAWVALRTWHLEPPAEGETPAAPRQQPVEQSEVGDQQSAIGNPGNEASPGIGVRLLWVALAACGSLMLLAVTNQMCEDVATVPFLWVAPLTLYLLTFILCFHSERWYPRMIFWVLLALALGAGLPLAKLARNWITLDDSTVALMGGMLGLLREGVDVPLLMQILGYSAGLLICCMVCHGELVRLKPSPRHLTSFYLLVAVGGALGGALVSLVAPRVFRAYLELHVGMWLCAALAIVAFWADTKPHRGWQQRWWVGLYPPAFVTILVILGMALKRDADDTLKGASLLTRNFYGVLRVTEYYEDDPERHYYSLQHGRISHGNQYADEEKRKQPTSYYGEKSGVGLAILGLRGDGARPQRIGVVGLGTGTIAAYGRAGDHYRFYDINPDVERIAETWFHYLGDLRARGGNCRVVLGDARLSLEAEAARGEAQGFDVLALDAFSSDAIPVHLLTREAFELYVKHCLAPGGVLAVHISNRYLDLEPVVLAQADHLGYQAVVVESKSDRDRRLDSATWVLLTRNKEFLDSEAIRQIVEKRQRASEGAGDEDQDEDGDGDAEATRLEKPKTPRRVLWTDDYSNLFQVLKR